MRFYIDRFLKRPDSLAGVSMVTCTHSVHGCVILFFEAEDFQEQFMPAIRELWSNNYTFVIQPLEN